MPKLPKLQEVWNKVDPYKTYAPLEKHQKLTALQMGAVCICTIFFFVYFGFSIDVYAKTPEPSKVTFDRAFPSKPPTALFQFTVMLPVTGTTTDSANPTKYSSPFSDVLTLKTVVPYKFNMNVGVGPAPGPVPGPAPGPAPPVPTPPPFIPPGPGSFKAPARLLLQTPAPSSKVEYTAYTFPVYGTVDPKTLTSTLLYFRPAVYSNSQYPLVFSVGPPGVVFSSLDIKQFGDDANPDFVVTDPNSSSQLIMMFENFDIQGPEINIQLSLEKRISSDSQVSYTAELFAPPSYSPISKISSGPQRVISITVKPNVNTIVFTPKNIFTFLGSISGIFPIFVTAGGIIASLLWLRMQPKTDNTAADPINTEMALA